MRLRQHGGRPIEAVAMGFFNDLPGPRTRASAEAASLGAAGRGIYRQCPSRHVLLGRTDQVAVAVTGSLRLAPEALRRQHQTETPPTLFTGRISPAMPTRSA